MQSLLQINFAINFWAYSKIVRKKIKTGNSLSIISWLVYLCTQNSDPWNGERISEKDLLVEIGIFSANHSVDLSHKSQCNKLNLYWGKSLYQYKTTSLPFTVPIGEAYGLLLHKICLSLVNNFIVTRSDFIGHFKLHCQDILANAYLVLHHI